MSYNNAKAHFSENLRLIDAASDPLTYNLNGGLLNLSCALEADLKEIGKTLFGIAKALQQLKQN